MRGRHKARQYRNIVLESWPASAGFFGIEEAANADAIVAEDVLNPKRGLCSDKALLVQLAINTKFQPRLTAERRHEHVTLQEP